MNMNEENFAYKVRHALNEKLDDIPESVAQRLEQARLAAVGRKKASPLYVNVFQQVCAAMSGISRLVRLLHSPLISALSPIAHIITSASLAIFSASAFISASLPQLIGLPNSPFCCSSLLRQILLPWAYNKVAFPASAFPARINKPVTGS